MCMVSINVPEEILLDLHEDKSGFAEYMRRMLALDLYKNKKVSLGYCASVAGMTKEEVLKATIDNPRKILKRNGINL